MHINIHESQHSLRHSQKHLDIYPAPDFAIEIPHDVNSSSRLNLIFDAKVRKSSSVMDIDFSPDDIIQEEEGNSCLM